MWPKVPSLSRARLYRDCLGYVGCSRIIASEMVQIPPLSERIISGTMVELSLNKDKLCIIEPSESFLNKKERL